MLPVLVQFGPFTFYTYTVLIDAGLAVALAALYLQAPAGRAWRWLDLGLAAILGGLIGARLLYVAVNAEYYLPHIDEVVQVWQGGLSWLGAPAGALLGAWLVARQQHEPLWPVLDALALPLSLLSLLAWGGCLAAGAAYGYAVTPGQFPAWFVSQTPDIFGLVAPRFPTQALGLAWSLIVLLVVWGARRGAGARWSSGALGAFALSLAALGVFFLDFTRGDPAPLIGRYRSDVVGAALVLVAASAVWALRVARGAPPAPAAPTEPDPSPEPPAASAATTDSVTNG